ncbi:MAG: WD40 repeat domain-containing serine/threonine protein kinase [Isosphaeraceae bacterium]
MRPMNDGATGPWDDERYVARLADQDDAMAAGGPYSTVADDASGLSVELQRRLKDDVAWCEFVRSAWTKLGDGTPAEEGQSVADASDPTRFGRFEVRRELGRGSFGVVFLAYDPRLRRQVALKVPRPEVLVTDEMRRRFEREARAAAGLDHPNLVPVFDAGEEGSISYIASAYCPGPTLAAWLKARPVPVPPRLAARIVLKLAQGVAHAHSRGVLHRDLKPGNVIMEPNPGAAAGCLEDDGLDGNPRVTDFGLARLSTTGQEATAATQTGAILGTPSYMAPEQAQGGGAEVGPAADVYGLGAILYALLVGRPPFQADSVLDTLLLLRTQEPVAPSRLRPRTPRDLETICLKCLCKEPHRRYTTAESLADDLDRFLAGHPVRARRLGPVGRLALWCRRQPALAATIAAAILAITAVASAGVWRVVRERDRYRAERDRAQVNLARALTGEARALMKARETGWMFTALDNLRESARLAGPAADRTEIRELAIECFGSEDPCFRLAQTWEGPKSAVTATAFSPDGGLVASGSRDGTVRIWPVSGDHPRAVLPGPAEGVTGVAYHPQGGWLAASTALGSVRIWRIGGAGETGPPLRVLKDEAGVYALRFSPDGEWLATGSGNGLVRLIPFEAVAPDPVARAKERGRTLTGHSKRVGDLAFSAGGKLLASMSDDGVGCVWDMATAGLIRRIPATGGDAPRGLAFYNYSQNGSDARQTLTWGATASYGVAWSTCLQTKRVWTHRHMFPASVTGLRQDSRGNLFTAGDDGSLRLWRLGPLGIENGYKSLAIAADHFGPALALDLSRDDGWVAVGYGDGRVRLWQLVEPLERAFMMGWSNNVVFAGGSRRLVTPVDVMDFSSGMRPVSQDYVEAPVRAVEILGRGGEIAYCREDDLIRIWDGRAGRELRRLQHGPRVRALGSSSKGAMLASGSDDGTVKLWDWKQGATLSTLAPGLGAARSIAWGPADRELAVGYDHGVALWEVARPGHAPRRLEADGPSPHVVAFCADSLAVSAADGAIAILDPGSGRRRRMLRGHSARIVALAFAVDGRRLVSTAADDTVRAWDVNSGTETAVITGEGLGAAFAAVDRTGRYAITDMYPRMAVCDLSAGAIAFRVPQYGTSGRFSADGSEFLVGTNEGAVRLYAMAAVDPARGAYPGRSGATPRGEPAELKSYVELVHGTDKPAMWGMAASPDGRWIAMAGHDAIVRLRNARVLTQVRRLTGHSDLVWCVAFSPDSKLLASGSANERGGEIKVWDVETGRQVFHLEGHAGLVTALAFVPGRPWLVSGSKEGTVRLWDVTSGHTLGVLHGFDAWVSGLAVKGDGRWLAAACQDGSVAVWDVGRLGAPPAAPDRVLLGHNAPVHSVAFHPDGRWLASGSELGTIILWDGTSFQKIVRLRGGTGQIRGLRFSGDGGLLATWAYQGPTIVWDLLELHRSLGAMGLDW